MLQADWTTCKVKPSETTAQVLSILTMPIGMPAITENNFTEFFRRICIWEKVVGAHRYEARTAEQIVDSKGNGPKEMFFTLAEIKGFIGFRTNATAKTNAMFNKGVINFILNKAQDDLRKQMQDLERETV